MQVIPALHHSLKVPGSSARETGREMDKAANIWSKCALSAIPCVQRIVQERVIFNLWNHSVCFLAQDIWRNVRGATEKLCLHPSYL